MRMLWPQRVAALVGAVFSGLAVVAGTRVLTGLDVPDYVVLEWLVQYNVAAGMLGMLVGIGLWGARVWAINAALALAVAHACVLTALVVIRATGGAVADDSLVAMTLRTVVWSVITFVLRH